MNVQELHLVVRALLVWCGGLTAAVVFLAVWAMGLEDRVRRRFGEDLKKALEEERTLR